MQLKRFYSTQFQVLKKQYYHLTARTENDEYFKLPMKKAWYECLNELKNAHYLMGIEIISFVLMNNHYHLIIRANSSELLQFQYLFQPIGLGKMKSELIESKRYLYHAYRYCYQNPLRAGIVKRIEDYPYSLIYYLKNV